MGRSELQRCLPTDLTPFCSTSSCPAPPGTVRILRPSDREAVLEFDAPAGLQLERVALEILHRAGLETAGRWFMADNGVATFEADDLVFELRQH